MHQQVHLPTRSSPFPYTTLFRSAVRGLQIAGQNDPHATHARQDEPGQDDQRDAGPEIASHQADAALDRSERTHADRKSTRLNSSHVSNSYAVFCLKKKILVLTIY